jgi:hypothetical protein
MSFITRAFTPPGTGGAQAQAQIAQGNALASAANIAPLPPPPAAPSQPAPPPTQAAFAPSQTPAGRQRASITASTMLGAAAAAGTTKKPTLG